MITSIVRRVREAGIPISIFSDVKGNPVESNLTAGVVAFKQGGHDGVVAVGGGSALDVGKCVAFMVAQSRSVFDFEDVGDWWTRANTDGVAPIIAVPTTAGTGSEVGRASVITREDTHEKKIIFHPLMMPKVAVEDPELAVGLPPFLTMATGMDALAHCFEAYCVKAFHPLADGVALEGIKIVDTYLPRAVADGNDLEARAYMFAAASMGATAFQKGLGAIHSVSHPVGARYDTHHGLTNGVIFPYVMVCNRKAIADKIPHIARALDLPGRDFDTVLNWIMTLRKNLGVPHTLAELGVKEADAGTIAKDAVKDPTASANPRSLTEAEFEQLTLAAIRGDLGG
jgi:alcohol dehydrogenase class IV